MLGERTGAIGRRRLRPGLDAHGFVLPANLAGIAGGALLAPLAVALFGLSGTFVITGAGVIAYSSLALAGGGDGVRVRIRELVGRTVAARPFGGLPR